jgi:hypothetical protein
MDEMKLLEDFRAALAPPDDRILAQARSRMLAADQALGQGARCGASDG